MHSLKPVFTSRPLRPCLLALALTFAPPSWSAPVTLNLKDADISALIASVSEITKRNFIVDPRVKAKVSVISSRPMDEQEIYQVFLSILAVHGFAAIPGDNVIKIVPAPNAKQEAIPTLSEQGVGAGGPDQMVTRVIALKNTIAAQAVPILRPLLPPEAHLAAYAPTNVLIVSDLAANVERISGIVARMDQASNDDVEIVALRNASASDLVRVLTTLESGSRSGEASAGAGAAASAGGSSSRVVADERTNSILLSGDKNARLRLRALIAHLDSPQETLGNAQVVYLRYAKAKDLLPVLQGISQSLKPGTSTSSSAAQQGGTATASGALNIQADEATNSLVISADPTTMKSLRSVIAQLDVRRAQVLVEAIIAEISYDKAKELGVQWAIESGGAVAGSNFTNSGLSLGTLAAAATGSSSTSYSSLPSFATAAIGDFTGSVRFGALVSALGADANTNVLSTPNLVTLDNQEAQIIVGQNVPFVTGTYTTSTGGSSGTVGNPFQTIERQDVGLTLKIKPQINEGNAIKLDIEQEVSSVVETANSSSQGPTTNKRAIKTSVLIEDGQILVLGGLIEDQLSETEQKVPGLGDIPLVGELFRSRSTSSTKRNLMVFLHPVILRDALQGSLSTNDKYAYIRQQQIMAQQRGVALMPDARAPVLPEQAEVRQNGTVINLRGVAGRPTEPNSAPTPTVPVAPAPAANPAPTQTPATPAKQPSAWQDHGGNS